MLSPYCTNRVCPGVPAWLPIDAKSLLNRCPMCGFKVRFRCTACGRSFPETAADLRWCPFCGQQFEQSRLA